MIEHLILTWHQHFGATSPDVIVRAPGRVNIIGEHTDYNEGWVMPGAMSRSMYILIAKSNEKHHWIAADLNEEYIPTDRVEDDTRAVWVKYLHGAIEIGGYTSGPLKLLVGGDLPVGAGISSSSSLVCGFLFALDKLNGITSNAEEIAILGSRVEREILGLQGGIMDQYAIMLSRAHHVMLLDCRTRDYKFITAEIPGCKWLLINTKVKHQLVNSDYNVRAHECKQAVEIIRKTYPSIRALRDVTIEMLSTIELPEVLHRRCVFVIEENNRVHEMIIALENQDGHRAGELLKASHKGLQHQYEVSCAELDLLANFGNTFPGVLGVRMMGGGFGGCVICLVEEIFLDSFLKEVVVAYQTKFGFKPEIILFDLSAGVESVEI